MEVEPLTIFVAEPYDDQRVQREGAIRAAVPEGFVVKVADQEALNIALTCKICKQIQSAQFGLADITGYNENVMIELGMLYGFNKPVIIVIEKTQGVDISIPSNIKGIEQIRFDNFNDLQDKLGETLNNLVKSYHRYYMSVVDTVRVFERQLENLKIAVETRGLIDRQFEAQIIQMVSLGGRPVAIINSGYPDMKAGMLLRAFQLIKGVNGNNIEQEVGLLEVKHPQRRISQAIVLSGNIGSSSWGNIEGLNILKPCLEPDYEKLSADEMKTGIGLLEMLLPWVYSTRGKVR